MREWCAACEDSGRDPNIDTGEQSYRVLATSQGETCLGRSLPLYTRFSRRGVGSLSPGVCFLITLDYGFPPGSGSGWTQRCGFFLTAGRVGRFRSMWLLGPTGWVWQATPKATSILGPAPGTRRAGSVCTVRAAAGTHCRAARWEASSICWVESMASRRSRRRCGTWGNGSVSRPSPWGLVLISSPTTPRWQRGGSTRRFAGNARSVWSAIPATSGRAGWQ
jgi:hypothetical protein